MDVLIDNRQSKIQINEEIINVISKVVEYCLKVEGKSLNYEVSVSFVDNDEIHELNKEFRNVDSSTDVLSFPMMDEILSSGISILGDIVICGDKALSQSEEYGHCLLREIAYLTAHSMFHLLGYDHMNEVEKSIMRNKEKEVMKLLGVFK